MLAGTQAKARTQKKDPSEQHWLNHIMSVSALLWNSDNTRQRNHCETHTITNHQDFLNVNKRDATSSLSEAWGHNKLRIWEFGSVGTFLKAGGGIQTDILLKMTHFSQLRFRSCWESRKTFQFQVESTDKSDRWRVWMWRFSPSEWRCPAGRGPDVSYLPVEGLFFSQNIPFLLAACLR